MRAAHHARSRGDGGSADLVDTEHLERGRRPDDIDDGIVSTDLVKVHLVDRTAVQRRLHRRQHPEDGLSPLRHPRRQGGLVDEGGNHAVGADHHVVAADDGTGAGDAAPDVVLELEMPTGKGEAIEQAPDLLDVGSRVDQ